MRLPKVLLALTTSQVYNIGCSQLVQLMMEWATDYQRWTFPTTNDGEVGCKKLLSCIQKNTLPNDTPCPHQLSSQAPNLMPVLICPQGEEIYLSMLI